MSAWVTVPSLLALRDEFNKLSPGRDKGADGTIGDSAHTSTSDHTPDEDSDYLRDHDPDSKNEVHALDIDSTGPWPGRSFDQIVKGIIAQERARWLDANDRCRLKYVIHNRKIYSQSTDFQPVDYTGTDPHTNHAHFSARYETACENDVRPWGVFQEDIVEQADITKIVNALYAKLVPDFDDIPTATEVAEAILNAKYQPNSEVYPNRTVRNFLGDVHPVRDYLSALGTLADAQKPREGSYLNITGGVPATLDGLKQRIGGLEATLSEIKAMIAEIPPTA
jgi:hypothetical protein